MKENTKEKVKNEYYLRIKDKVLLDDFIKLLDTNLFKNANDLINICLEKSLPMIYNEYFGDKVSSTKTTKNTTKSTQNPEENDTKILEKVGDLEKSLHQIFVKSFIFERLLSVLYNSEYYKSKGIKLDNAQFSSGKMEQLPEHLAVLEQEFLKQLGQME